MDGIKRCKCANCHQFFRPDPRNAWHQRYCQADACHAASKAASQQRWLAKPENHNYFRGPDCCLSRFSTKSFPRSFVIQDGRLPALGPQVTQCGTVA